MNFSVRSRQKLRAVQTGQLRKIGRFLLVDLLGKDDFELALYLVGSTEMRQLNETFLHHEGSTDVITFDYAENPSDSTRLHGEIFVCIDEAVTQAKRFRTTWQQELVRYLVHGVLHLCGFDDKTSRKRRSMKREEDKLVAELIGRFELSRPGRGRTLKKHLKRTP